MSATTTVDNMQLSEAPTTRSGGWSTYIAFGLAALAGLVAGAGLLAVITAGFALSFDAIGAIGRASGVRAELAWLLPAAVDGAMAVGTVTAAVVRRLRQSTAYPWTVVLVNAAISVACNALHAYAGPSLILPAVIAMAVSAVPAVNLALSVHLLVTLVDALASVLLDQHGPSAHPRGAASVPLEREQEAVPTDEPTPERSGRKLQRAAWQWAREHRRPDGSYPSGAEIGRAHRRSARWGRLVRRAGLSGSLGRKPSIESRDRDGT